MLSISRSAQRSVWIASSAILLILSWIAHTFVWPTKRESSKFSSTYFPMLSNSLRVKARSPSGLVWWTTGFNSKSKTRVLAFPNKIRGSYLKCLDIWKVLSRWIPKASDWACISAKKLYKILKSAPWRNVNCQTHFSNCTFLQQLCKSLPILLGLWQASFTLNWL